MHPILRNVLAIVAGVVVGGIVNGAIISISADVIPPPEGAVLTTEEGLKAAMQLMEPKHFIMPWLAHGMGSLVGAMLAALIAATQKIRFALSIGLVFLLGGMYMVVILPSPWWFTLVDLVGAYLPMAYIGGRFVASRVNT
ncbi:MAG: hypothetical protein RLZZ543_1271 [Bacteroidota bacterium]|jgi:hypothetical protein